MNQDRSNHQLAATFSEDTVSYTRPMEAEINIHYYQAKALKEAGAGIRGV